MKENDILSLILFLSKFIKIMNFIETKKRILETYQEFIIKNLMDNKMLEINRIINENENFVTTSSCAGRIIIIGKKH